MARPQIPRPESPQPQNATQEQGRNIVTQARFLTFVRLDVTREEHRRILASMMREAAQAAQRLGTPDAEEARFRREIQRMQRSASPETSAIYNLYDDVDQPGQGMNWVIRWLIWAALQPQPAQHAPS